MNGRARAEALGAYLELAYAFYREVLGLDPPVPDDDGLLDVYVDDLDDGYFGHARIEQPAEEGCPGAHGGYIEIATDFGDRDTGRSRLMVRHPAAAAVLPRRRPPVRAPFLAVPGSRAR